MSGPKVVRVVTREELLSQCEGALTRLDWCLRIWQEELSKMGHLAESNRQEATRRRQELDKALREDRFADVLRQAAAEVGFLETDIDSQRQRYVEARASEARRHDSVRRTAQELAKLLKASKVVEPELLVALGEVGIGNGSLAEADATLSRALAVLSSKPLAGLSESQRALAQRLGQGFSEQSLEAWKAQHVRRDGRLEAAERLLAEVEALDGRASAQYEARLAELQAMDDGPSRNLRIDSVVLDLAAQRTLLQRLVRLRRDAELLRAEIDAQGDPDLARSVQRLTDCWDDATQLETVLAEERPALDASRKRRAAHARRVAVLQGLSSLGYSVSEGMGTALEEAGRLVVKKPDMPGYGVELVGGAQAERLQVRAVALAKSRDTTKDLEAETKWCSDFTDLRTVLAATGTQIVIEQALPVGKVALRVVESEGAGVDSDEARRAAPAAKHRSMSGR